MQKTIEDLYHGNIAPNEHLHPKIRGYQRKKQELLKVETALLSEFTQAQAEKYKELALRQVELSSIELTQTFVDGFRLGMRLAVETFCSEATASGQDGVGSRPQPVAAEPS